MNFVVTSSHLLKHLQSISGVLSTNNTLPILDNFLFDIKENVLTISASDVETTMTTSLSVASNEDGKIAIPAKLLLDCLKYLPEQPCTFSVDKDSFEVEIAYDNGKSKMVGFDADDFPRNPIAENSASITISGEILSEGINKTLFASGNDDLRPTMSGVYCEFSPAAITFVATDAHKLVKYSRSDAHASGSSSFILPKKPLNLLKANLSAADEVQIQYTSSNAVFTFSGITLMCRLIDGKYPNYEAVIPKESPNVLTIDRLQLLGSLKRVSIFANKTTHLIKVSLAGSELSLSAEDIDFSNAANERLTCSYQGDDIEIGFNSRFLMEILTNLNVAEVHLKMSEPNRAGIIVPADSSNEHEEVVMVVMPLMLNR